MESRLSPGTYIACDNAPNSVTVSGHTDQMIRLIAELKKCDVFVKEIHSAGIAPHSPLVNGAAAKMLENIEAGSKNMSADRLKYSMF